jgi:gliding motility-associated-like protein
MQYLKYPAILLLFFVNSLSNAVNAQTACPPNIDFENGNFINWECKTGYVSTSGGQNIVNLNVTGQAAGRHELIASANFALDPYGGFPVNCPNGSNHSVKLGNDNTGNQAEGVSYTYNIPPNAANFSILYQYAVVFENPGHSPEEQPRFRATVLNVTDNDTIDCVSFDFTSSGNLPGFKTAPGHSAVLYKDWTPVSLDLSGYAGKTIRLEFTTADCTLGGHFGYAYVDVNSECDGSVVGSTICFGDTTVNLVAPYGYQNYTWYTDNSFTQLMGNGQVLTLNPAPNVGTVYPVIVVPYPGYGCTDTIFAVVKTAPKPPSFAGNDITTCRHFRWQLGGPGNTANMYNWTPANLVTNPYIANPMGFINTFTPQPFIVKTTTRATGCFSYDTVILSPIMIDTTLLVYGKTNICTGQQYATRLEVVNISTGIQWLRNNIPITGAVSNSYIPTTSGSYRAKFVQIGCTDTTRAVVLTSHALPKAVFSVNKDTQCVTSNSFVFRNASTINSTDKLFYSWTFGDGTTSQTPNPIKQYSATGNMPIQLVVTSEADCADTATGLVKVFPNIRPDFKWSLACTNVPITFYNETNEQNSIAVNYNWDFGNSVTAAVKQPAPQTFAAAGVYTVSLKATALGCENDPKSITKPVQIYAPVPGIRYRDITVPEKYSSVIFARGGIGDIYRWQPGTQLSSTSIKAPLFYAGSNMDYTIYITDKNGCVTADTLQMLVLKGKGWYLPNAFTPNNDGLNDVVRPYLVGMKSLTQFSIYNRFGNLVFNTKRNGEGWDGTSKGAKADAGTYVWVLEYVDVTGAPQLQKGAILLIR